MTGPSSMDIGVVIPILSKYGGAERYLIECLRRWQERHDITLYSAHVNDALLAEHGVTDRVKRSALTGRFPGDHAFFLNALLLPKIWRSEIGRHDIYHTHLWPTHMVDLHPMVWFPHEPLRLLHDLRYEQNVVEVGKQVAHQIHVYPKYHYDRLGDGVFEATLNAI
ncbi:MAG: glycosyltransferase, partial [Cucumibacter sp.]